MGWTRLQHEPKAVPVSSTCDCTSCVPLVTLQLLIFLVYQTCFLTTAGMPVWLWWHWGFSLFGGFGVFLFGWFCLVFCFKRKKIIWGQIKDLASTGETCSAYSSGPLSIPVLFFKFCSSGISLLSRITAGFPSPLSSPEASHPAVHCPGRPLAQGGRDAQNDSQKQEE